MPNTEFILLATLMVIVAMMLIVIPLIRKGDPAPIAAGALVAVVPLAAALLYFAFSNWPWGIAQTAAVAQQPHSDQASSLLEIISRLEEKLQDNPDDVEGWQLLGRSYGVMSRYPEALEAYGRARDLTGDQDVNALTGYAEALAMVRGGGVDDEIAGLFEKALQIAPNDKKALWYGGLSAFDQGRAELARSRWQQLLAQDPPEQMAALLRQQIAAANEALGDVSAESADVAIAVPEATRGEGLALRVSIAPGLAGRAGPDSPVFILARQVGVPGPPLAVVRKRVADLPLDMVLTDANAMSPGNVLSAHENVEVVARVSLGGTPTAQTGDLSGSKIVASNGTATIEIDSVVSN